VRPRLVLFLPLLLVACVVWPAVIVQAGEQQDQGPDPAAYECDEFPRAPDGSRRQSFDAFEPVGGLAAIPPRINTQLAPGESASYCVGFQNRGSRPVNLSVEVMDVAADARGLPSSQREAVDRGASRWVRVPATRIERLAPGDVAWLQLQVQVPDDALAGSSYASILATGEALETDDEGSRVQSVPAIASQLFFDIPGDAARQGEVVDIRSPRVIWWDGLGAGDLPILDRLRGLGIATVRFSWHNTGSFTSEIGGRVELRSDLSRRAVERLPVERGVVIAGARRQYEVTWRDNIPLLGRFTPVLEVEGESGRTERHELQPIWVIPAWWYLLAVAVAIAIPTWLRHRSRQRYYELLARLEAAEDAQDEQADYEDGELDFDERW
jgi:hypothetical protein